MTGIRSHVISARKRRNTRKLRSPIKIAGAGCSILFTVILSLTGLGLAVTYMALTRDLPSVEVLPTLLSPPHGLLLQPTQVYDREGQQLLLTLENPAAAGHEYLSLETKGQKHLPPHLVNAIIAVTDPGFWQHPGVTPAFLSDQTGSTIAQRLVSEYLLWEEPETTRKKVRQFLLAAQITSHFGRDQLLEWYLNSLDLGRQVHGADSAARVYFGKSASDLNLAEAALLAGISLSPNQNPFDNPDSARENQRLALDLMVARGYIDPGEAARAKNISLQFRPEANWATKPGTALAEMALLQLIEPIGWDRLNRGGLRIISTLDYELQVQVSCTTRTLLSRISGAAEILQGQSNITQDGKPCEAARLLPTMPPGTKIPYTLLGANTVVMDHRSGQILALSSELPAGMVSAVDVGRPPGTTLTPFVYLSGFTRGLSPGSLLWDIPDEGIDSLVPIPDFDNEYNGPLRLRNALANDELIPAAKVLIQTGAENVWRITRQLGLTSLELNTSSEQQGIQTLWDGGRINLLQAVQAYGTLANEGILAGQTPDTAIASEQSPPLNSIAVLRVEDYAGAVLLDWSEPQLRPVITPQLSYLITHVLSDEAARWRSMGHPNPLEIGRPVSAKIGQTLDKKDTWVLGSVPQLSVGVWIGTNDVRAEAGISNNMPAGLWHAILQYATRSLAPEGWREPAGISRLEVCDPSGLLPTPNCPNVVTEVFLNGSEPTQSDQLYRVLQINRETGRLATAATAPELIEEQVFLIVPPDAKQWASQVGLPTPPEDFDIMLEPDESARYARISSPQPFNYVRGKVTIRGTAAGDNFDFFRLQVGQGLNPQAWIQIGEDHDRPVTDGALEIWDTGSLDGLFVIQLLVVRNDQTVESANIQVTVDNLPPQVEIASPQSGASYQASDHQILNFEIQARDNLDLQSVELYLNEQQLIKFQDPPYIYPWQPSPGDFVLKVKAVDWAGNIDEQELEFSIDR